MISDKEYILYITGRASKKLARKIETDPEFIELTADFDTPVILSAEDEIAVERICENVKEHFRILKRVLGE